ncbi:hypothetical protein EDB80DRAFT_757249 [Ilyonectria destructans]|nr:hypothetical protein EDB80DRAFT_757249 [Ilyonectria destructans]
MSKSLVTEGTGFIGFYVVKLLLEHGHHVKSTVHSPTNKAKCGPLQDLQAQFPEQLWLFKAYLIKDGFKNCVEPALEGTRNVVESVNQTESVTRVVMTSSSKKDVISMKNETLSECYWNEFSSVITERGAWKLHYAQSRWSLVVINPGLVIGPSLTPKSAYPVADGREVTEAHLKVGENMATKGRYTVSCDHTVSMLDMANLNMPKVMIYLAGQFIGVSKKWADGNIGLGFKVDNTRSIKELGISYHPAEEVVQAHYLSWLQEQSSMASSLPCRFS